MAIHQLRKIGKCSINVPLMAGGVRIANITITGGMMMADGAIKMTPEPAGITTGNAYIATKVNRALRESREFYNSVLDQIADWTTEQITQPDGATDQRIGDRSGNTNKPQEEA
jgi:hypothetical protein